MRVRVDLGALRRRALEGGLMPFTRICWPEVETQLFMENWHHHLIADALMRATVEGKKKIYIGVPPGTSKTHLSGVSWPAWSWTKQPWRRILHTTYGSNLAVKAARQMRDLVNGYVYSDLTSGHVKIPYQNTHAARWFENNHGGSRFSGSTGGEVTGRHAHDLIGDDLNKAIDAYGLSSKAFDHSWEFWSEVLPTRQADPEMTNQILIGQRLRTDDVPGRWIEQQRDEIELLVFPMRFEADHPHVHPLDPRHDPEFYDRCGGLLWPERFPEEVVQELERSPTVAAAQLQQRPIPPGGQLLTSDYLGYLYEQLPSALKRTMEQQYSTDSEQHWAIFCDATFKGKHQTRSAKGPDYVVIQVWCRYRSDFYLVDQIRGQWSFRETKRHALALLRRYPWIRVFKIEDAANAAALQDDLQDEIPGLQLAPHGGGVLCRVQQSEGIWASGSVRLPSSAPWMGGGDGFVAEHLRFDGSDSNHDDQVSCSSLALIDLGVRRKQSYFERLSAMER